MSETTRRDVLCAGTVMLTGAAVNTPVQVAADAHSSSRLDPECNFGHSILFMDEYYRGTLEILGRLHGEVEHVAELSARAAGVIRGGRTVWTSMDLGHLQNNNGFIVNIIIGGE